MEQRWTTPAIVCVDGPYGKICADTNWKEEVDRLERGVQKGKYLNLQRIAVGPSFSFQEGPGWYSFDGADASYGEKLLTPVICSGSHEGLSTAEDQSMAEDQKVCIYEGTTEADILAFMAIALTSPYPAEQYYVPESFVKDDSNYTEVALD